MRAELGAAQTELMGLRQRVSELVDELSIKEAMFCDREEQLKRQVSL